MDKFLGKQKLTQEEIENLNSLVSILKIKSIIKTLPTTKLQDLIALLVNFPNMPRATQPCLILYLPSAPVLRSSPSCYALRPGGPMPPFPTFLCMLVAI